LICEHSKPNTIPKKKHNKINNKVYMTYKKIKKILCLLLFTKIDFFSGGSQTINGTSSTTQLASGKQHPPQRRRKSCQHPTSRGQSYNSKYFGFGFWVFGFGFWVLGFGFWVLGFGFWVLCFGFWVLGFVFCVLCFGLGAVRTIWISENRLFLVDQ
jgi:hypothetical protein